MEEKLKTLKAKFPKLTNICLEKCPNIIIALNCYKNKNKPNVLNITTEEEIQLFDCLHYLFPDLILFLYTTKKITPINFYGIVINIFNSE